jgi:N-acetylglucosaminyl-diphospho-decaprenol L-rhamnosyltransferase
MTPFVDVVIVNFRTKELTLDAALSALAEPETNKVIVVENGSGDDSAAWLKANLTDPNTQILVSEKNLGFGGGNNLGVRGATAEFVFLLNSDATVLPGALALLAEKLKDPTIGIVAPAILMPNQELQPNVYGLFPTPARILSRKAANSPETNQPDWISGAAMMLRRQEFLDIGGFDENLFMYMEDVDLCKRYSDKGLRIEREPSAKIVHLGGASATTSKSQKEQFRKSTDYYLEKHGFSPASRATVRAVRSMVSRLRSR